MQSRSNRRASSGDPIGSTDTEKPAMYSDTAASTDEIDRQRRERLMKEVNAAYAAGDENALRRILEQLQTSPDSVACSGVGADLIRILRQLKQIRNRIAAIEAEIATLSNSEIAKLKNQADQARAEDRDLILEMASAITERITVAKRQFESESGGRR